MDCRKEGPFEHVLRTGSPAGIHAICGTVQNPSARAKLWRNKKFKCQSLLWFEPAGFCLRANVQADAGDAAVRHAAAGLLAVSENIHREGRLRPGAPAAGAGKVVVLCAIGSWVWPPVPGPTRPTVNPIPGEEG